MATVEQLYRAHQSQMGATGRLRRAERIYVEVRDVFIRRALERMPDAPEREIRIEAARRMYATDIGARRLLDRIQRDA